MTRAGAAPAPRSPGAVAGVVALALAVVVAGNAEGQELSCKVVDRAVVRFHAPELGGTLQPRFIAERVLAFEARLGAMADTTEGIGDGYDERRVRSALDRHVGEEMAASLAHKLIAGLPPSRRPSQEELSALRRQLSLALVERLGGQDRVSAAARAEGLDLTELDELMDRQALAAWYIDRAVTPILQTTDEQLREVFRTAAHPYRGQSFEKVREAFERWFIVERVSVAESAFLQGMRSRVRIVVEPGVFRR